MPRAVCQVPQEVPQGPAAGVLSSAGGYSTKERLDGQARAGEPKRPEPRAAVLVKRGLPAAPCATVPTTVQVPYRYCPGAAPC